MIQFADIDFEFTEREWGHYKTFADNDRIGQIMFGKLIVWCEEQEEKERLPEYARKKKAEKIVKYIRRTCKLGKEFKINGHTYKYSKVFRAVRKGKFPALSQAAYDSLTHRAAQEVSKALNRDNLTNDELAQMLKRGVVAHKSLRPQCKDFSYPRGGYIYIMGLSAAMADANTGPVWFKLGGTVLDPYQRSSDIDKRQIVFPGSLTVHAWSAEVSDWREAELELQAPFKNRHPRGRDYFLVRWEEAYAHAKLVGQRFAKESLGRTARNRLANL